MYKVYLSTLITKFKQGEAVSASIVIPAHNESAHIDNLLISIISNLDREIEIVVVDNGSSDDTVLLAEKYECNILRVPTKVSPSTARNIGVKASSGDYLVFLDADVIITPQWARCFEQMLAGKLKLPSRFLTGSAYHMSRNPGWLEVFLV